MDKLEKISIEDLIPYARNSRTHSDEQVAQIAASIKEFGFTNPVLIDNDNGIIAGHGRVLAGRKLKLKEIPCLRLGHLTDAQKKAYVIADNKLALNSGWDAEMLKLELVELKDDGFNIDLIGFDGDELAEIFAEESEINEGLTDEDEVPEVPEEPVTKLGDVWILGNYRLMCGDSTSLENVAALAAGRLAQVVFTDPPYGVSYVARSGDFQMMRSCCSASGFVISSFSISSVLLVATSTCLLRTAWMLTPWLALRTDLKWVFGSILFSANT